MEAEESPVGAEDHWQQMPRIWELLRGHNIENINVSEILHFQVALDDMLGVVFARPQVLEHPPTYVPITNPHARPMHSRMNAGSHASRA
jgi:hypothetical protein